MISLCYAYAMKDKRVNRTLLLSNEVSELARVQAMLEELVAEALLPAALLMPLNLVLEEALTNVMFYAFEAGTNGEISLELTVNSTRVEVLIVDGGRPFDPTLRPDPDTSLPVDERPIGGLGIFLIRTIMDEVGYERVNDTNRLKLAKTINNSEQ